MWREITIMIIIMTLNWNVGGDGGVMPLVSLDFWDKKRRVRWLELLEIMMIMMMIMEYYDIFYDVSWLWLYDINTERERDKALLLC